MKRTTLLVVMALILTAFPMMGAGATGDHPALTPAEVSETVAQGGSFDVAKTVHTPEIPPSVDVCLLEDETGSFFDDIGNLQTAAGAIYDAVVAGAPNAEFAVAGFRDYNISPYGDPGDWVYQLLSPMNSTKAAWLAGIGGLSAGGGNDGPEAQYDAIVAAAGPGPTDYAPDSVGPQNDCGWRTDATVTRVLLVTTDAPFHGIDGTHANDHTSTLAALTAAGVVVIGIKAPGAGSELDALAGATGGSIQPLTSDGDNIAAAILAGLAAIEVEVSMASNCADPISTTFAPASLTVTSGDDAGFTETITVAAGAAPGVYTCQDWALIDGEPMTDADGVVIFEEKSITVGAAFCDEGVNPAGKTPKAPGTGQNEDGFYLIGATADGLTVELIDDGSGTVFGPFASGTNIKYTENDDEISITAGPGAVDWKIKGLGDATVRITDGFGNEAFAACLVPPPPK